MGKTILFSVVCLTILLSSCRKYYTCACTIRISNTGGSTHNGGSGQTYVNMDDAKPYDRKMSKKTAESACRAEEDAMLRSWSTSTSTEADCYLK